MDNQTIALKRDKAEILGGAHAMAADMYASRHKWLAIPATIFSIVVGATALASFVGYVPDHHIAKLNLDIVVCFFAIVAAVLTALQTFFDYSSKAQKHADIAARLFALGREWAFLFHEFHDAQEARKSLDDTLDEIIRHAPRVSRELQQRSLSFHTDIGKYYPPDRPGVIKSHT